MRRTIVTLATALAALTAVACEPPPPPAVFQVNSYVADGDATPGDGVCETAPGNGICTITAAVEEGNALGTAVIDLPTEPHLEAPLDVTTITGDITLRSEVDVDDPGGVVTNTLTVAPGAILRLEGFGLYVHEGLVVEGAMVVDRTVLLAATTISEGGAMFVLNTLLTDANQLPPGVSMITNEGTLAIRFSHLSSTQPLLHTASGAASIIGASTIFGPNLGACTGAPVTSEGYNVEPPDDDRCTNDEIPVGVPDTELVPYGELGCGTTVTVDSRGHTRPFDDDGDGIALCGAGPVESGW